jgi:fructose-bisphosphate aldolase, class I
MVALDHALASGQRAPLDQPAPLLAQVLEGQPDGLILTWGMGRLLPGETPPWLLTADYYATSVLPGEAGDEELHGPVWTAHDALQAGATGLKCLLVFGKERSREQLENVAFVARLIAEAGALGVPVMVETTLWGRRIGPERAHDAAMVAHAARIAFELGADIIKIPLPDDLHRLEALAQALPVPLVLMGGPATDPATLFPLLRNAFDSGVRGVALGRNVWQRPQPAAYVRALRMLVHDQASPQAALEQLREAAASREPAP